MGRPPGLATPAAAAIARANGRKKPRDRLPAEVIAAHGDPPADLELLRAWTIGLLAKLTWLDAQGKVGSELVSRLRASLSAIDRALPAPARAKDDDDELDDDLEHAGPELAESELDEEPMHG